MQAKMTDAEKAATFDLLQEKRVIQVRKGKRHIGGRETQATWITHGENEETLVEDYVISLEAERSVPTNKKSKRALLEWHKANCKDCVELAPERWDFCAEAQQLLADS